MPHATITVQQAIDFLSELAHEFAETSIKPITEGMSRQEQEFTIALTENLFNAATPRFPESLNAIHDLLLGDDVDEEEKVRQATAYFTRTARRLEDTARKLHADRLMRFTDPAELEDELAEAPDCADKRELVRRLTTGEEVACDPVELEYEDISDIIKESVYEVVHAQLMALAHIARGALLVPASAAAAPAATKNHGE
jgi:hypothetical protein